MIPYQTSTGLLNFAEKASLAYYWSNHMTLLNDGSDDPLRPPGQLLQFKK